MNDDLISRSALLEAFGEEPLVWDSRDREDVQMHNDWLDYTKLVKEAPAVDAQKVFEQMGLVKEAFEMAKADLVPVRHGRWEEHPHAYGFERCSVCHDCNIWGEWADGKKWSYCPNCGAKMDALTFEEASRKLGQQAAETLKKLKEEGHA